jgi:hypothetical protein
MMTLYGHHAPFNNAAGSFCTRGHGSRSSTSICTTAEDLAVMNPWRAGAGRARLILYESTSSTSIDDRFHPQLMPADPVMRAGAVVPVPLRAGVVLPHRHHRKGTAVAGGQGPRGIRDSLTQIAPVFVKQKYMLGTSSRCRRHRPAVVASGLLWYPVAEAGRAADEVRRAYLQSTGLYRGVNASGDAQVKDPTSTTLYLIRAIWEWCGDNGLTPYVAVKVDGSTRVPLEPAQR